MIRRRRRQGPLEAFGVLPDLVGGLLTAGDALDENPHEQQLCETEGEAAEAAEGEAAEASAEGEAPAEGETAEAATEDASASSEEE